jgi:hypothetical protein
VPLLYTLEWAFQAIISVTDIRMYSCDQRNWLFHSRYECIVFRRVLSNSCLVDISIKSCVYGRRRCFSRPALQSATEPRSHLFRKGNNVDIVGTTQSSFLFCSDLLFVQSLIDCFRPFARQSFFFSFTARWRRWSSISYMSIL